MQHRPSRRAALATIGLAALGAALPAQAASARPLLIRGADVVLTMAPGAAPLVGADILVRDGAIAAVARGIEPGDAELIDAHGCLAMPGLVDTHWHMWNTIARGLGHSLRGGFVPTMAAFAPCFQPGDNAAGVRLALAEAVNGGITTVHDWAHNIRSPAHAEAEYGVLRDSGVRARFAYGYPNDAKPDQPMDLAHLTAMARRRMDNGLVSLGICARGPDRSADAVWHKEWDTARALGLPITTHMASDAKAAALGGIARLAARGGMGPDVQLVHLTGASTADLALVRQGGSPVSLSPWTEIEVGYGLSQIAAAAGAGLPIGLSVDTMTLAGAASMFETMKLSCDLPSGMAARQDAVDAATVLGWATLGGASTLGLGRVTGSLERGKRADLILIRTDALNTMAAADPVALVTHAARPENVDTVLIDGVVHKSGGRLTRIDLPALRQDATTRIARIRAEASI